MCGIVGVYKPDSGEVLSTGSIERMRDQMSHRGPDGVGVWRSTDGRCGMGHRRLSVIDLSEAAAQPMANHDGSVIVVFNGEIYNHATIRAELERKGKYTWKTDHSDTEVLLHAYEEWGLDCVHRFLGMFAFGIYDARIPQRPLLHLVRDRIGIKPLYFCRTSSGEWAFASEIRALMAHPHISPQMDLTAFWHYLTFIVAPAPLTLFRGIFKLPAGHWLTVDHRGNTSIHAYWDCRPSAPAFFDEGQLSEEEAVGEVMRLLRQSIARRMVSDVPFGVLLSGGVDSSMNVALMSELMDRPVTTFTVGYETHEQYNELEFARRVSRKFGTEHHEVMINQKDAQDFLPLLVQLQDEPIADNVCIPLYFLAKLVRDSGTTVVQVGEGADENFLGYWWCEHYRKKAEEIYNPARRRGEPPWWRRLFAGGKARLHELAGEDAEIHRRAAAGEELFWGGATCWWGDMRRKLTPDTARFRQEVHCPVEGLLPDGHRTLDSHQVVLHHLGGLSGQFPGPEVLVKIPFMEHKLRLPEHLLMRVDKLTMAHAVEARVPFLDHELVEFAAKLPPSYKLKNGVGKWVLKKAAERYLDHDIIYRKKQGFGAPMEQWLKEGDFGRRCLAAFERSRICKEKLLDNDYFTGILKKQMGTASGYSFHIWTVMNAILWYESWVEGKKDCL